MKKLIYGITTLALIFGFSGCAKRPESISASHISFEKYSNKTCMELNTIMTDARFELSKISEMQNTKANGDAVGVFLVLIPISQMTGDYEGDVAKWKGEVEAIETAQIKNKCKY